MAKSRDYWRTRFEMLEETQNKKALKYTAEIYKAYTQAMNEIEKDISRWLHRFAENEGVSLSKAKKLLNSQELKEFKWTVDDYIKYGQENALNQQWMKELENASARVHISRLEALKLQLRQHVEKLYGKQLEGFESFLKEVYQDQYYHTVFEIQSAFGVGFTVQTLDNSVLNKVISKPWTADNLTFSQRIWRDRNLLIDTLHKELTQSFIRGEGPQRLITVIQKKMNTSRSNAARLVQTEQAFFSASAQKEAFKTLGVEQYEIVATLDSKTSEICKSMDGKVFHTSDFQSGVTANPFHARCRTTTAPYFDDMDSKRFARGIDGETYYVPSNMKYDEWYQTQISKHGEEKVKLEQKKQKNHSSDKTQYNEFKETLGRAAPKSFEEFQDIKYNKNKEWEKLQDNFYVKSRLNDGTYGSVINAEKQDPHMESTRVEGKSYFYDNVDVQALLDDYAGTGFVEKDKNERRKNTEIVVTKNIVGVAVSKNSAVPTKAIKIHHSKKRTHIVPIREDIL